ncbi:MAG: hypothetical protein HOL29_09005 [Euryarchaeota archaeon]|nr:hypothetical protein [Euryarchaeota archaeon]
MYKGYQFQLFSNDWGMNSGFEGLADKLHELLPLQGKVQFSRSKNKNLELFRKAQNAAYDLFNNGLCNKRGLFNNIYGFAPTQKDVYYSNRNTWTHWEDMVEEIMTPIIQAAAKEQGVQ